MILYCVLYRYGMVAPDEFMFTEMATISSIAGIIQRGGLSDQQKAWMENGVPEGANAGSSISTEMPSQPLCPWCTCCY